MVALVEAMRGAPGIEAAWIGRPNEEGLLLPEAVAAPDMPILRDADAMVNVHEGPKSGGPAGRAWRSARAQLVDDAETDPSLGTWRQTWSKHGWRSSAAVPLRGIGGVHRILNLYSRQRKFFRTTWSLDLLTEFGLITGTAIENRVKHAALDRSRRLLEALFAGAETLLDANSEQGVLQGTCAQLGRTGLFLSVGIGRPDETGVFRYDIAVGMDAGLVLQLRQRLDEEESRQLLGVRAWNSGEMRTTDSHTLLSSIGELREIAPAHWKAAAAVPILRGGRIFAVMTTLLDDSMALDAETLRLIRQLTRIIGRALDELDLKETLRTERMLQSEIARRDSLTRLPNRLAFAELLPEALARAGRQESVVGVGILDLDNFKPVNDQYGHAAGDIVLRTVAMRLRATLRETDFVARLGGDEFALVMEDWTSATRADGFCDRLLEAVSQPIILPDGNAAAVSFSLGLTFFPADDADPEQLIRHADIALYAVKGDKSGRPRCWATYQDCTGRQVVPRYRALLHDQQVAVHYQPVIDISTGEVVSIEALARLPTSNTLIPPKEFLLDFDHQDRKLLFEQVLRGGIAMLQRLEPVAPRLGLSINIDAEVLSLYGTAALLGTDLKAAGIAASRLTFELLESHEFQDIALARQRLEMLRASGIKIAIDDLGLEFSNLKRVQQLQVDIIKIDRSFLRDIAGKPDDLVFLSTFQTLSDWLGVQMCVEGVETMDMLDAARILGVPLAQGYGIARPMPADQLEAWLRDYVPKPLRGGPKTLLGAFALHTRWLRMLMFDGRSSTPRDYVLGNGQLSLARFIMQSGQQDSPFGRSYAGLLAAAGLRTPDMAAVRRLADQVRKELAEAVRTEESARRAAELPVQSPVKPGKRLADRAFGERVG